MSVIADIASAVTAELNAAPAGTFAQSFTAQRYYLPRFTFEDMATLHVSVLPKSFTEQICSRSTTENDYVIDIAVQQQVDPTSLAAIDALVALVQQISDHFRFKQLAGVTPAAVWVNSKNEPIYAPDHLEKQQFTSVLSLTFRVQR